MVESRSLVKQDRKDEIAVEFHIPNLAGAQRRNTKVEGWGGWLEVWLPDAGVFPATKDTKGSKDILPLCVKNKARRRMGGGDGWGFGYRMPEFSQPQSPQGFCLARRRGGAAKTRILTTLRQRSAEPFNIMSQLKCHTEAQWHGEH